MPMTLFHNPRCSKSRQALEILQNRNLEFEVREYLKEPLSKSELDKLCKALGEEVEKLIRIKDLKKSHPDLIASDLKTKGIIDLLIESPALMERPILLKGREALIARPPELLESFIS